MYSYREIHAALCGAAANKMKAIHPLGVEWKQRLAIIRNERAYSPVKEEILREANRAVAEPVPPLSFADFHCFEKAGTRFEYEQPYFDRRRRLAGLVFATLIWDTDRYMTALENLIWEICNEFTWCLPAHLPPGLEAVQHNRRQPREIIDLFAAETAHGLAEALCLLEERLNPWMAYRIRKEIRERTLQPLYREPSGYHWEADTSNWAAVCGGAVGMAALLLEEDQDRLAGLLSRIMGAMDGYLSGFGNDGGCPEGIGYWLYGFGYYTYFAEMLENCTGGAIRLMDGEKPRRIAEFPLSVSLSDGCFVNYSDAAEHSPLHTGLISRLGERYGLDAPYMEAISSFHQDHCYRFAHICRNLLWSDHRRLQCPVTVGQWELPDLQWYVSRHKAGETMLAFSAKGGHNEEPHNHNDVGSFVLHAGGESLLAELGAGVYTRDYFGDKRYTFIQNSSRGHSLPVIDGGEQQSGLDAAARLLYKELRSDRLVLKLDVTAAYPVPHLEQAVRELDWSFEEEQGIGRLLLHDSFRFTRTPERLEEAFISLFEPALLPGKAVWQGQRGVLELQYDEERFVPAVEVIHTQAHLGEPVTVYRLTLEATGLGESVEFQSVWQLRPTRT